MDPCSVDLCNSLPPLANTFLQFSKKGLYVAFEVYYPKYFKTMLSHTPICILDWELPTFGPFPNCFALLCRRQQWYIHYAPNHLWPKHLVQKLTIPSMCPSKHEWIDTMAILLDEWIKGNLIVSPPQPWYPQGIPHIHNHSITNQDTTIICL